MSNRIRSSLISLVIIAVLFFSAIGPTIVYADGGTTTDTPPTETTNECTSDSTSSECSSDAAVVDPAATSEPVATEVAAEPSVEPVATEVPASDGSEVSAEATAVPVTEEAAPATEAPVVSTEAAPATEEPAAAAEVAPAPAADATVLDAVPENTTVAVLDSNGQSEPLATQAAADAIATTSDPIWCPAGQSPTPGANGCTQSFTSFTALLTFLSGNATYQGAGTIFVQQGAYQGGESTVNFNNYNLSNISNANLTITGGWNTSNNTVDPAGTSTFNNTSFVIGSSTNPWGGSLSINNLSLSNTSGTGIVLVTQSDINLANVNVTNSTNGAGAELNAGGDVTMNNSKFERNKTAGAIISHARNVAIANSSFSNPANARRQATGLDITADGSVSLFNVLANQNRNVGANINAGGRVSIASSSFSDTKNMVGSNFFGYGLQVVTPDAIDIDSVTANNNFLWGASLKAGGNVTIANSFFNANSTASPGFIDDTGLLVTSGGNVSINNSEANDNRLIGATINATGDVSINNSRFTNNNGVTLDSAGTPTFHGYGLQVVTLGSIFISGVTASNNTLFGAHLDAGVDVSISSSDFSNQTSGSATDQTGRGLEVISGGNVFMDNTTINNNQTFGANIQAGGDVFLDTITATNNGLDGVDVQTNCRTLFLINGTYSNNGQYGLSIINSALNQTGSPVFATNGTGNIFQDPGTCVFTAAAPPSDPPPPTGTSTEPTPPDAGTSGDPTTPVIPVTAEQNVSVPTNTVNSLSGVGPFNNMAMLGFTIPVSGSQSESVTLNSFLANTVTAFGTHIGLFIGNYSYIDTKYGVRIVEYFPNPVHYVTAVEPR